MLPLNAIDHYCQQLRLPTIRQAVSEALALAQQQEWPPEEFLRYLLEEEVTQRRLRRIERHLRESRLPPGKTLAQFDQHRLPLRLKRQIPDLVQGEVITASDNILIFGRPGTGKTHATKYPSNHHTFTSRNSYGH